MTVRGATALPWRRPAQYQIGVSRPSAKTSVPLPQDLGQIWLDHFDWLYRHHDYAIYPIAIHPDASGKPHVMMALERLIDHMMRHSGVRMMTHSAMAAEYRKRYPLGSGKDHRLVPRLSLTHTHAHARARNH